MNEKLLNQIFLRLSRSKLERIVIWVVKDIYELDKIIRDIPRDDYKYKYNKSERIMQVGNITIRFILNTDSHKKFMGMNIDEVIIDES